jgi:DNA-binding MarR family transcriptional regulator
MSWTFLSNHGHVIIQLAKNPEIRIAELADLVGITERRASAIINDLKKQGYIEAEKIGRRNRYRVIEDAHLRHPLEDNCEIGAITALFRP